MLIQRTLTLSVSLRKKLGNGNQITVLAGFVNNFLRLSVLY